MEVLEHLLVVLECLPGDFGDGLQDFIQGCISLTNLTRLENLSLNIRTEIVGSGVSDVVVAWGGFVCQLAYIGVWIIYRDKVAIVVNGCVVTSDEHGSRRNPLKLNEALICQVATDRWIFRVDWHLVEALMKYPDLVHVQVNFIFW